MLHAGEDSTVTARQRDSTVTVRVDPGPSVAPVPPPPPPLEVTTSLSRTGLSWADTESPLPLQRLVHAESYAESSGSGALHHAESSSSVARVGASGFFSRRLSVKPGGRRYSVEKRGQRISVCRISKYEEAEVLVDEVDVPPEIFDVLANNMPRLLQLISHWSKRTGEVTVEQFERVLHTLGVRYTAEQVSKLFRVLDADANGKVGLDEMSPDPESP